MAQTRAEAAEKELAHVKEKAWAIMEEKDAQLRAARVSILDSVPSHTCHAGAASASLHARSLQRGHQVFMWGKGERCAGFAG